MRPIFVTRIEREYMIDFKVGQKVWSSSYGDGRVLSIEEESKYPVVVEFLRTGNVSDYTSDGRYSQDELRTLFFKELQIPLDALMPPVEQIVLNTGDVVFFNNGDFGYVETYSGPESKVFFYHTKVPKNLDEAFGPTSAQKHQIKKVVGNVNA